MQNSCTPRRRLLRQQIHRPGRRGSAIGARRRVASRPEPRPPPLGAVLFEQRILQEAVVGHEVRVREVPDVLELRHLALARAPLTHRICASWSTRGCTSRSRIPGQRYFAATPASHTCAVPETVRGAAVAGAVSTAAASVSVSAIARTCVAAVTTRKPARLRPFDYSSRTFREVTTFSKKNGGSRKRVRVHAPRQPGRARGSARQDRAGARRPRARSRRRRRSAPPRASVGAGNFNCDGDEPPKKKKTPTRCPRGGRRARRARVLTTGGT